MTENYNYSTVSNRLFDITNNMFNTYLKTLTITQERTLAFTRLIAEQVQSYEVQNRALINEFTGELERAQELARESVRETAKRGEEVVNQARATVNRTVGRVTRGVNGFQDATEAETIAAVENATA